MYRNSSRSILSEAILNHRGKPNFHGFSAGSHPVGHVNRYALEELQSAGLPITGLPQQELGRVRCARRATQMNLVFTACDSVAKEVCPRWPGQPITAHWGIPDPGNTVGTSADIARAFRDAFITLDRRIGLFLSLPLASLDKLGAAKRTGSHRPRTGF